MLPKSYQIIQQLQEDIWRVRWILWLTCPFFWRNDRVRPSYNICLSLYTRKGFPCSSVGKESACNAGDLGLIPGLGRSPGEGNGNPFQYPCLENPIDRGAWWAIVHGVTKSRTWLVEKCSSTVQRLAYRGWHRVKRQEELLTGGERGDQRW